MVKWKDLPIEDATWEGEQVLQHPNLKLLEDKQSRVGRTVMFPFRMRVTFLMLVSLSNFRRLEWGKKARKRFWHKRFKVEKKKKEAKAVNKKGVTERSLVFYKVDQEKVTFD